MLAKSTSTSTNIALHTLKDLHLSRFQNVKVLGSLMMRQQQGSLMTLAQVDEVKKVMDAIPHNKDLCDLSSTSQQSLLSNATPAPSHLHNYTIKFQTNSNLPSYFKRQSGMSELFPNRDVKTYLGVVQHTLYDQSVFNPQTYAEREVLSRNFVAFASLLTKVLSQCFGKWADFVDPSSGTGYFEQNSYGGFVSETDELIAKQAGLQVRDLGCCRVLASLEWGTRVWLGSFVTEASEAEVQSAIQMIVAQKQ